MRPRLAVALLALPIAALAAMLAHARWDRGQGTFITVRITGYDPQDVLRGHYARFRIAWRWEGGRPDLFARAICVTRAGFDPPVRAAAADCPLLLRGGDPGGGFMPVGVSDQLFLPEQRASKPVDDILVDLSVLRDGSARFVDWHDPPQAR